jgi:hypothetical protein
MTLIAPASGVDGAFNTTFAQAGMAQITAPNIPVPIVRRVVQRFDTE